METKDVLFTVGLVATLIVSVVSLVINLGNRRNGMRDHLYKEQMKYFVELSKEIHLLLEKFYEIKRAGVLSEANDATLEKYFDDIDTLTETYEFMTPEEISDDLTKLFRTGNEVHLKVIGGTISNEDIIPFQDVYFDLSEKMREHLGIEKLSNENRQLSFGRLKLTDSDKK